MLSSCGCPPVADAHHPQPANVRDWTSWDSNFVVSMLQSEDADEYASFLQQSAGAAGWESISTAVALCYQAGATHVLLTDVWSVRDPDWRYIELAVHWCAKRWNRSLGDTNTKLRDHGKDIEDRGSALAGKRVVITPFEFDDLAWAESTWDICGNYMKYCLPSSLWISRCGTVRPARSFANLIYEIGAYEDKSGHHNEVQNPHLNGSRS